jgi:glycerol kinase
LLTTGITNQRETTLCWSRETGNPLCNAIVWDDARTNGVVRQFEKKLDEEGLEIDDEDEELDGVPDEVEMGTGTDEAAIGESGEIEVNGQANGAVGAVGKALENLGFAGRGKEGGKRRRKGKEGLVDVYVVSAVTICR